MKKKTLRSFTFQVFLILISINILPHSLEARQIRASLTNSGSIKFYIEQTLGYQDCRRLRESDRDWNSIKIRINDLNIQHTVNSSKRVLQYTYPLQANHYGKELKIEILERDRSNFCSTSKYRIIKKITLTENTYVRNTGLEGTIIAYNFKRNNTGCINNQIFSFDPGTQSETFIKNEIKKQIYQNPTNAFIMPKHKEAKYIFELYNNRRGDFTFNSLTYYTGAYGEPESKIKYVYNQGQNIKIPYVPSSVYTRQSDNYTRLLVIEFRNHNSEVIKTLIIPIIVTGEEIFYVKDDNGLFLTTESTPLITNILHNVPGDNSSSFLEKNTETCASYHWEMSSQNETSTSSSFNLDISFPVKGIPVGIHGESSNHTTETTIEKRNNSIEICKQNTEKIINKSKLKGTDGDLFIGNYLTFRYGPSINVVFKNCEVVVSRQALALEAYSATDFMFTKNYVETELYKHYQTTIDNLDESSSLRVKAQKNKKAWEKIFNENDQYVANADPLKNFTFSAVDSERSYEEKVENRQGYGTDLTLSIDESSFQEVGLDIGGIGYKTSEEVIISSSLTTSTTQNTTTSSSIGFTLDDTTPGDQFHIEMCEDQRFGTHIFRLLSGTQTSCPYEGGDKRFAPELTFEDGTKEKLFLGADMIGMPVTIKAKSLHDTNEERNYWIHARKYDDATVSIGGVNINSLGAISTDPILPGTSDDIILNIVPIPSKRIYDIQIKVYGTCPGSIDPHNSIAEEDIINMLIHFGTATPATHLKNDDPCNAEAIPSNGILQGFTGEERTLASVTRGTGMLNESKIVPQSKPFRSFHKRMDNWVNTEFEGSYWFTFEAPSEVIEIDLQKVDGTTPKFAIFEVPDMENNCGNFNQYKRLATFEKKSQSTSLDKAILKGLEKGKKYFLMVAEPSLNQPLNISIKKDPTLVDILIYFKMDMAGYDIAPSGLSLSGSFINYDVGFNLERPWDGIKRPAYQVENSSTYTTSIFLKDMPIEEQQFYYSYYNGQNIEKEPGQNRALLRSFTINSGNHTVLPNGRIFIEINDCFGSYDCSGIGSKLDPGTGLLATYFNNSNLTDEVLQRIDSTIDFNWENGSPDPSIGAETFSVVWEGQIVAGFNETYTFSTTTDDGVRLWIDNQLIIDEWAIYAPTTFSGTIQMQAGKKVNIKMEYFENRGGAVAQLNWSSSSLRTQIIPKKYLFPKPVDFCDDFNAYSDNQFDANNIRWGKWNENDPSPLLVDYESSDDGQALSIVSSDNITAGIQDYALLKLGDLSTGKHTITWKMKIPEGKKANIQVMRYQNRQDGGFSVMLEFDGNKTARLIGHNQTLWTYPSDEWFELGIEYDLDNGYGFLIYQGVRLLTFMAPVDGNPVNQLGGILFYANQETEFYIDELCFSSVYSTTASLSSIQKPNEESLSSWSSTIQSERKSINEEQPMMNIESIATLGQNYPNPVKTHTVIPVNIPMDVQKAFIQIIGMDGRIIQQISISDRGQCLIRMNAGEMESGMYFFALNVDSKLIDTKKMSVVR